MTRVHSLGHIPCHSVSSLLLLSRDFGHPVKANLAAAVYQTKLTGPTHALQVRSVRAPKRREWSTYKLSSLPAWCRSIRRVHIVHDLQRHLVLADRRLSAMRSAQRRQPRTYDLFALHTWPGTQHRQDRVRGVCRPLVLAAWWRVPGVQELLHRGQRAHIVHSLPCWTRASMRSVVGGPVRSEQCYLLQIHLPELFRRLLLDNRGLPRVPGSQHCERWQHRLCTAFQVPYRMGVSSRYPVQRKRRLQPLCAWSS